jgi:hypothetical protein
MAFLNVVGKIRRKIWGKVVNIVKHRSWRYIIYQSYWHSLFQKNTQHIFNKNYFASIPNPGAGIGHQMANWIAGYWFSTQFNLQFAHFPFSGNDWEVFLGFGEEEAKFKDLISSGYQKVLLPIFDEYDPNQLYAIKKIMASYGDKKIVFITEQDQGYKDQYGVMDVIKKKFHQSATRKNDKLIYDPNNFNIAVHIRRGDINIGQINGNTNLTSRWQNNDYYLSVLKNVKNSLSQNKPISIYLFSQGEVEDFADFQIFDSIIYCLDMSAKQSFLHMVFADLIITSKSSFSYKPALLSNGIKVCPKVFWHGYPTDTSWILVEEDGSFSTNRLKNL